MKFQSALILIFSLFFFLAVTTKSQDFPEGACGEQAGGRPCAEGFCCSNWGWCGNTSAHCDPGNCQSQCPPPPSPEGPILCGIQNGGARCPEHMCCTVTGHCANARGPSCSPSLCQSQCGPPHCGFLNPLMMPLVCPGFQCCTIAGICAPISAPSCRSPFCQLGCLFGQAAEPKISMVKAIA